MKFKQEFAQMALGAILGAAVMLAWQGRELNRMNLGLSTLRLQYDELEQENIQLDAQLHEPSPETVLQVIRVTAQAPDAISELRVVQFVKEELAFLVGKPMQTFLDHAALPAHLLDRRTLVVNDQSYTLRVTTTVVVRDTLVLQITASRTDS
jgi:hypothetical protein